MAFWEIAKKTGRALAMTVAVAATVSLTAAPGTAYADWNGHGGGRGNGGGGRRGGGGWHCGGGHWCGRMGGGARGCPSVPGGRPPRAAHAGSAYPTHFQFK